MDMKDDMVRTVTQYAKDTGISRQAILIKIKQGKIRAIKDPFSGMWIINDKDNIAQA